MTMTDSRVREGLLKAVYADTYPGEALTKLEAAKRQLIEARVVLMRECGRLPVFPTAQRIADTTTFLDDAIKELTRVVTTAPIGSLPMKRKETP